MSYPNRPVSGALLHWREGHIAHIRFNRPAALNALDVTMASMLQQACVDVAADPLARVLVISGEGRSFQAGGDVAALASAPEAVARELLAHMHVVIETLIT